MRKFMTAAALVALCSCAAWAQNSGPKSEELNKSRDVLEDMTSSRQIPQHLLNQAQCVGVIPEMTKGGFIAGAEHGDGVVSCRTTNGWSAPAFFSITGGSVGFQAGIERSQIVLLMNDKGKDYLMNDNFQLGAEAVAAGPTEGASGAVGWEAPILSYAKSKGLYAGINLQGSTIKMDRDTDHNVYGSSATTREVLDGQVRPPADAQPFISALRKTTQS